MTDERYIEDLKAMIEADKGHLMNAVATGHRVQAKQYVDSIIDNQRELEDAQARVKS